MRFTTCIWPLIASAAILVVVIFRAWRRRACPAAPAFMLAMLALLVWTVGFALEISAVDLPGKLFWANVQFLGIAPLPVAWLAMVLAYTQRRGHPRWLIPALLVAPLVTNVVIWTDRWHHLFHRQPSLDAVAAPFVLLNNDYGPWFYAVHAPYGYLVFAACLVLLIRALLAAAPTYRRQIGVLLAASVFPLLIDVLYVLGFSPVPHLNLTTLAFSLCGLLLGWSLFRFQFLDLIPVARTALVEAIADGWIVLDSAGRFADLNATARSIVVQGQEDAGDCPPPGELIGSQAAEALPPAWGDILRAGENVQAEVELGRGEGARTFDLRLSLLHDGRGQLTGRLVVLRDITARRQMERDQERLIGELQDALAEVKTLSGLLPICAHCKKIRDDRGYWHSVETYVVNHSTAQFTHSICPDCARELFSEYVDQDEQGTGGSDYHDDTAHAH